MAKKYDGWCLKSYCGRKPWLYSFSFKTNRSEVIKEFNRLRDDSGAWRRARRGGWFEVVKVKLVEVGE